MECCSLTCFGVVDPVRLTIATCVGCGSMREFESCVGTCRERKLEFVSGGDYDELATSAAACRIRIRELLPVVEKLASAEPRRPTGGDCTSRYANRDVGSCGQAGDRLVRRLTRQRGPPKPRSSGAVPIAADLKPRSRVSGFVSGGRSSGWRPARSRPSARRRCGTSSWSGRSSRFFQGSRA